MPKRWTFTTHANFFKSIRILSLRGVDIYLLSNEIWATLEKIDDPTVGADPVPGRKGRYERKIMGYLLTYDVFPKQNKIRLLLVE